MSQTCYRHPAILVAANCADCGQPLCATCIERWRGEVYCLADYATARHGQSRTQSRPLPSYRAVTPQGVPIASYRAAAHATPAPTVRPAPLPQARPLAPLTNAASLTHPPSFQLPGFNSVIWSSLGLVASSAELVSSIFFYRLLDTFYQLRNAHANSYLMRMTLDQAIILFFIICITILYNGAILLLKRQNNQPPTSLPLRRQRSQRINSSHLTYMFGGFAIAVGIFAIVTLLIFIVNLSAIPEGLNCCG